MMSNEEYESYYPAGPYCERCDKEHYGKCDNCCDDGAADYSKARQRWECAYCGDPVDGPDDYDYNDDDGIPDNVADAMTLSSAYGGDWWDM